ncbi:MAG: asparagine synthase (glutamine-hydrolyzing) [Archangium sp.]|nr:asparagine synthase (glutamine-hydrolyzing) [Archangium sp.]
MCGIAGVLHRDGSPVDEGVLARMASTIAHRGPDGQGVKSLGAVGLAHRRLAVVDLSPNAAQPMVSADGDTWVTFNGEIYNFQSLREELKKLGHTFRTSSDTEVILAAWKQWGEDAIAKLDGMFALALYEPKTQRLVLTRDRTGKKPLYVYEDDRRVVFGSELKALLAYGGLDTTMWREAIPQFLTHGYVPTPFTFYERIRKVRPAHVEVFERGTLKRTFQYWEYPLEAQTIDDDLPTIEARVRELFLAAVERRMVADVPLGAFLSGGVDSTLVVAAMARASKKPVKTFSIGFEGYPAWDETGWARLVAERYGTEHTEFKVKPESFELIEKLAWHYDEPFGDSSAIPTYIVSKLTREKVTVALTGDGGDELFAGYPRFLGAVVAEKIPSPLRRLGRAAVKFAPHGQEHQSTFERARRFAEQASRELPARLRNWVSVFPEDDLKKLLKPELQNLARLDRGYEEAFEKSKGIDTLNQVLFVNARTYLLDDLNVKMDRASMAASLESRAPFLDTELMNYVSRLPGHLKLRGVTTKWILKRALKDFLPEEIVTRKKMGFGVPLGAWFRGELEAHLNEKLLASNSPLREWLVPGQLEEMVARHRAGQRDYGLQFWNLSMLDAWLRRPAGLPADLVAGSRGTPWSP